MTDNEKREKLANFLESRLASRDPALPKKLLEVADAQQRDISAWQYQLAISWLGLFFLFVILYFLSPQIGMSAAIRACL